MSDGLYALAKRGCAEYMVFILLWPALGWVDVHIIPSDILLADDCVGEMNINKGQKSKRWYFKGPQIADSPPGSAGSREVTKQIWRDVWLMKCVHYFRVHPANNGRYIWLAYQAK